MTPNLPPATHRSAITAFIESVLLMTAMYALFRYSGHFPHEQSGLLALVCGGFAWIVYCVSQERKKERLFSPFWISIEPAWYAIFLDFKILDEQGCDALRQQLRSVTAVHGEPPYHVLRNGVTFTVLKPDLVYWNDRCSFRGSMNLQMEISEITGEIRSAIFPEYEARFCVRSGNVGYEFGIKTAESVQRALDSKDPDHGSETGLIRIATLPYWQFWIYYHGLQRTKKTERQMVQALKEYGWEEEERDPEFPGWPVSLRHKYFTVHHRPLHWW